MSAQKQYTRRFIAAMVGYAVLLVASIWLLERIPAESVLHYPVALLPVIPVVFGVAAFMAYLRRLDELQRRIQLDGLVFSVGCTGLLTLVLGFLENGGAPRLSMIWVLPMLVAFWGVGVYLAGRRYR